MIKINIHKRLQQLKDERNLTNYELAKKAGLSETTVTNLFKRNNAPTFSTLETICFAYGITLSQFFTEENDMVTLTDEQKTLITKWSTLSNKQKNILLELISNI